jgi:hypothetical protein
MRALLPAFPPNGLLRGPVDSDTADAETTASSWRERPLLMKNVANRLLFVPLATCLPTKLRVAEGSCNTVRTTIRQGGSLCR